MAFKLAIGNIVHIPLKFSIREGAVDKRFAFTLTAKRRSSEEVKQFDDRLEDAKSDKDNVKLFADIRECLLENVSDWTGQRLVLQENNEPAAFDKDSFGFMLDQPGLLLTVWLAYQRECASKEKN